MTSILYRKVLETIEENGGKYHGIIDLASEVGCSDCFWLRTLLRRAESNGKMYIIRSNGGRGLKSIMIIIKRKRKTQPNSGGMSPRKVRV
jgi:hypothetical protein